MWTVLDEPEQEKLIDGDFKPRKYAEDLTLRKFAITSPATLKADRQKLKKLAIG